jgi:hypothetical protein
MAELQFDELDKSKQEEVILDYSKIVNDCEVDLSIEMPHPEILLSIGTHEYKNYFYDTPIMTAGEFSAIVAQSKAKKTFLKSAFLGCYIGGSSNLLFPNIKTHRDKEYSILDFDTEQGKYYTQRAFRRVLEISKSDYTHYHGYATRHLSSSERLGLIDYCLKNQSKLYKVPVKLISIDGIADLVENTNDIVMSKEASDYILKWTYDYNIHITTIIHKSSTTNKPLGHLGTYVLKKAETVIDLEVSEDGNIKVTNPYSRGYRFDEFSFNIDKESLPYLIDI